MSKEIANLFTTYRRQDGFDDHTCVSEFCFSRWYCTDTTLHPKENTEKERYWSSEHRFSLTERSIHTTFIFCPNIIVLEEHKAMQCA